MQRTDTEQLEHDIFSLFTPSEMEALTLKCKDLIVDQLNASLQEELSIHPEYQKFLLQISDSKLLNKFKHLFKGHELIERLNNLGETISNHLKQDLKTKITSSDFEIADEKDIEKILGKSPNDYLNQFYKLELVKLWIDFFGPLNNIRLCDPTPRFVKLLESLLEVIENAIKEMDSSLNDIIKNIRSGKFLKEQFEKEIFRLSPQISKELTKVIDKKVSVALPDMKDVPPRSILKTT